MAVSRKVQGHLLMLVVMTIFGFNIPVNKYLYMNEMLTPFAMTTLRMSFAAVAFWIVSLFFPKEKVTRKDMLILLIGGLSGMAINQGFFAFGLSQTSSVDASIITTSSPLFAMIIAAIILKEPITLKKTGGVVLGGLGAIILVYTSQTATVGQHGSLKGDFSVLTAQLFYSFYLVITRPLSTRYSSFTMMKWMFTFSAIAVLPLFGKDLIEAPLFKQTDIIPFLMISFVLIGATFTTYMLIPFAQKRIRPTTISMYNNVQPLIASIVAILFMNDKFTLEKLLAAVFIFAGVYLVTTSKSRKDIQIEEFEKQE